MDNTSTSLVDLLARRDFEFTLSTKQLVYYNLERAFGHALLRRSPPALAGERLLNLGCGPHCFPGWVNADDYSPKRRLREAAFRPNWNLDITRDWKCPDEFWDGIFTEHVIEHVTYSEAVHVFRECLRTLRPGAWLRVSVPDVTRYVEAGAPTADPKLQFPSRAIALSFVTQMHMHRSTWDPDLMTRVLGEVGFRDVRAVSFRSGTDARLLKDDSDKGHESLYVEARK
jgi:predicted SAM-dependent methyltransferase